MKTLHLLTLVLVLLSSVMRAAESIEGMDTFNQSKVGLDTKELQTIQKKCKTKHSIDTIKTLNTNIFRCMRNFNETACNDALVTLHTFIGELKPKYEHSTDMQTLMHATHIIEKEVTNNSKDFLNVFALNFERNDIVAGYTSYGFQNPWSESSKLIASMRKCAERDQNDTDCDYAVERLKILAETDTHRVRISKYKQALRKIEVLISLYPCDW